MKLNFGRDVLVLPESVLTCSSEADALSFRALLWLASDLSLAQKPKQLAGLLDCDQKTLKAILQFWKTYGVLVDEEKEEAIPVMAPIEPVSLEKPSKRKLLARADELPNYTSSELADLMEKRASVRTLADEAQQILGKMFNPSEINILVGMYDYLGMSEECILMLLAHCKKIGKTNLRAIEKYAYSLVDKGITESDAMEEELCRQEAMHSFEGEVRTLFGMQKRAMTSREGKMLASWISFGYDIEVVRLSYEMTIAATNEPSLAYANAILERWHAEGLNNLSEIEAAQAAENAKRKSQRAEKNTLGNSFDTDDFFEAALRRSFGDNG